MADNLAAATTGDRRKALEALRNTLAESIDLASPDARAPLAAQYQQALDRIAALPNAAAKSTVDQLKEARDKRRTTAKNAGGRPPGARKKAN